MAVGFLLAGWPLWAEAYAAWQQEKALSALEEAEKEEDNPVLAGEAPSDLSQEKARLAAPYILYPPFILEIPTINLKVVVGDGTDPATLRKGPGLYHEGSLPGEGGNVAIAGHRTTYGAPFRHVDELKPGDLMIIRKGSVSYIYRFTRMWVVEPTDWSPIAPTEVPSLTLTTCHPPGSAAYRLIIRGELEPSTP